MTRTKRALVYGVAQHSVRAATPDGNGVSAFHALDTSAPLHIARALFVEQIPVSSGRAAACASGRPKAAVVRFTSEELTQCDFKRGSVVRASVFDWRTFRLNYG